VSERVRREVRELVEGFGAPRPGLAARAAAGLPDRPGRTAPRWAAVAAAALAVTAGLVLWTARGVPHQPAEGTMDPAQARAAVRAAVPASRPVLLPAAMAPTWSAEVTASAGGFRVRYTDPNDATRSVTVATGAADLGGFATLSYPAFHGDRASIYATKDQTLILVWQQAGVSYQLVTTGLGDAEFWQIANSLG
jgi:hypothetical protein